MGVLVWGISVRNVGVAERVATIDRAKGVSILLVALGHSHLLGAAPEVEEILALVRMPLFFFLAGVFFCPPECGGRYLRGKADALLKPYFVVMAAWLVCSIGRVGWNEFLGVFYANGLSISWVPMWFLPHLFLVFAAAVAVARAVPLEKVRLWQWVVGLLAVHVAGVLVLPFFWEVPRIIEGNERGLHGLPWSVDIVLLSLSFFAAGYSLRVWVRGFRWGGYAVLPALGVLVLCRLWGGVAMDLNWRVYTASVFTTVGAAAGIVSVLSLSQLVGRVPVVRELLLWCGRGSLFILIFQYPVYNALMYRTGNPPMSYVMSVFTALAICEIVNKWAWLRPFFLAKKARERRLLP